MSNVRSSHKNWLLSLTLATGVCLVFIAFFTKERVPTPKTFAKIKETNREIKAIARAVDEVFENRWHAANIEPSAVADQNVLLRRLGLSLAGTVPSIEELRRIESIPEQDRLDWWLARLLEDRRTSDHLAERFARGFVGVEDGPFIVFRRHRFTEWLSDQFQMNRPYDQVARDLLAGKGLWTDTPQTNYVSANTIQDQDGDTNAIELAAKTSRSMLAMRLDCLECHDDFLGTIQLGDWNQPKGGEQIDFHHLAAFFGQTKISLAGVQDRRQSPPYQFQLLDDNQPSVIEPRVPYLEHLLPEQGELRWRLAQWITHPENKPFARAAVNRLWAVMFGRPLIEPIDDIPWGKELPPELELLADDFIAHGFDIQRTIRLIAASRVFQLDSSADFEITTEHEKQLAVFPLTRLRPEQVARSLLQATTLKTIDARAGIVSRLEFFGRQNEFINRFGDFGKDEFVARGETVTQRLLLMNGDMIRERIDNDLLAPARISSAAPNPEKIAEVLYLACFTRYPTAAETSYVVERLRKSEISQKETVQDLFWALFNSAEFGWSH